MISGNGGSGGLNGYIKGIISAEVVPPDAQIRFYCGPDFARKIDVVASGIEIRVTNELCNEGINLVFGKKFSQNFVNEIDTFLPDIIFFMNGYISRGLDRYPNIMVLHNQLFIDTKQLWRFGLSTSLLKLFILKRSVINSMKRSRGVIFLSKFSMEQALERNRKINNPIVIPFGFENENRKGSIDIKALGNPVRFLYISEIYPYKNQIELVRGLSMFKRENLNIELHLVGNCDNRTYRKLKKTIKETNMRNNVIFHKWINHDKIKSLIDEMDIFVYASCLETTGYGLIEGMARGSIIMAADKFGFKDILGDGGVYFDPAIPKSIFEAASRLIQNTNLLKCCAKISLDVRKNILGERPLNRPMIISGRLFYNKIKSKYFRKKDLKCWINVKY